METKAKLEFVSIRSIQNTKLLFFIHKDSTENVIIENKFKRISISVFFKTLRAKLMFQVFSSYD